MYWSKQIWTTCLDLLGIPGYTPNHLLRIAAVLAGSLIYWQRNNRFVSRKVTCLDEFGLCWCIKDWHASGKLMQDRASSARHWQKAVHGFICFRDILFCSRSLFWGQDRCSGLHQHSGFRSCGWHHILLSKYFRRLQRGNLTMSSSGRNTKDLIRANFPFLSFLLFAGSF